jgi:hypothetical protein
MSEATRDAIWRDIDQSGVEFEMRIAALLEKREWIVKHHQYYLDYDENKGRELDILAEFGKAVSVNNYQVYLEVSLLVECKKLPGNAWTFFFQHNGENGGRHRRIRRAEDMLVIHSLKGENRTLGVDIPTCEILGHVKDVDLDAELYRESVLDPKKSNRRTDNVFEATMALTKAREYYRKEELKERDRAWDEYVGDLLVERSEKNVADMKSHLSSQKIFDGYRIFQPIVVFEGNLFTASLRSRWLREASLVRLWLEYSSSAYKVPKIPIDICTASHFPKYLETYEMSINQFEELATSVNSTGLRPHDEYEYEKPWIENAHLDVLEGLAAAVDDIPRPPIL